MAFSGSGTRHVSELGILSGVEGVKTIYGYHGRIPWYLPQGFFLQGKEESVYSIV
jgi:hypothetical protein